MFLWWHALSWTTSVQVRRILGKAWHKSHNCWQTQRPEMEDARPTPLAMISWRTTASTQDTPITTKGVTSSLNSKAERTEQCNWCNVKGERKNDEATVKALWFKERNRSQSRSRRDWASSKLAQRNSVVCGLPDNCASSTRNVRANCYSLGRGGSSARGAESSCVKQSGKRTKNAQVCSKLGAETNSQALTMCLFLHMWNHGVKMELNKGICPMTCLMLHFHAPLEPTTLRTREAIQSGLATPRCPHRVWTSCVKGRANGRWAASRLPWFKQSAQWAFAQGNVQAALALTLRDITACRLLTWAAAPNWHSLWPMWQGEHKGVFVCESTCPACPAEDLAKHQGQACQIRKE